MKIPPLHKYAVFVIIVVLVIFPIFWIVSTSFKGPQEWFARPVVWFPGAPNLDSYNAVFGLPAPSITIMGASIISAVPSFINSAIAAGVTTLAAMFIGYLAAYSISRFLAAARFGKFLYFFVLTTRMLPPIAVLIPLLVFFSTINLIDNVWGLVIIYTGINVAFVIWMVRGFIDDVPREIEEAATLEGVGKWGNVFKVTFPLVKGGLAAAALFVFILSWTEFGVALILTRSQSFTLPVQLLKYQYAAGAAIGPISALSTLAIIPPVVFGYLIQKHLVRGLSMGAIKGRK